MYLIGWLSLHHLVILFLELFSVLSLGHVLSQQACYMVRGRALGVHQGGQPTALYCDSVCGGGVQEGPVTLALLSAGFQSLSPLPTIKLGSSGADSWVGGFVYILGPCGSLQRTLL